MSLASGAVAAVQGDEILNAGGDQCSSLGRRVREDLVIREPYQGGVGNNRDDVVALGAELPGDVVRKHLVQQQRLTHELPGQELTLAQPGLLGGRAGSGDLRVDLAGVGSPVADSGVHPAQRIPVLSLTKLTRSSLFSLGSAA